VSPKVVAGYRVTAGAFVASVLVQAFLAGRGLFVDFDLIEVHGYVGNAVLVLAVAQVILAFAATGGSAGRRVLVGLSGALVVLTIAQTGLGYVGRDEAEAAAWHVVNGVLIFGVATGHLALALVGGWMLGSRR